MKFYRVTQPNKLRWPRRTNHYMLTTERKIGRFQIPPFITYFNLLYKHQYLVSSPGSVTIFWYQNNMVLNLHWPLFFNRINYIKFLEPYSKHRRAHRHGHNMQAVMKHPQAELVINDWLLSSSRVTRILHLNISINAECTSIFGPRFPGSERL